MVGVFDAYASPDLLRSLVLANLMSERLWSLGHKVPVQLPVRERLTQYQRVVDKYFTHLTPDQVAERDGVIDLDTESARLGAAVVDSALENIIETLKWRARRGTIGNVDSFLALIADRKFPAFNYGTIEGLHEHLAATTTKSTRVVGLSSCLDEAALFSALAMTGSVDGIDGIVVLGSASHYTVFGWSGEPTEAYFDAWWFYGKNKLFTQHEYSELVRNEYAGDAALAFADRLPGIDTVIAREGSWRFGHPTTTLGADRIEALTLALDKFFGFRIVELDRALIAPLQFADSSEDDALFEACLNQPDAAGVRQVIHQSSAAAGGAAHLAAAALQWDEAVDLLHSEDAGRRQAVNLGSV